MLWFEFEAKYHREKLLNEAAEARLINQISQQKPKRAKKLLHWLVRIAQRAGTPGSRVRPITDSPQIAVSKEQA